MSSETRSQGHQCPDPKGTARGKRLLWLETSYEAYDAQRMDEERHWS